MNITSPELSFLTFNPELQQDCNTDIELALPVCDTLAVKAQILVDTETDTLTTDKLYVAICDDSCNVLLDENIEIQPICSKYKFDTTFEGDEVLISNPYNLCNTDNDEPISVQDFTSNPFNLITSTDLDFRVLYSPFGFNFQLYCEGLVYTFVWDVGFTESYQYTQTDNFYYVRLLFGASPTGGNNFKSFLNDIFDVNHGTTSTYNTGTDVMAINNMPTGSYLNNFLFVDNINTVTASTNIGQYFYWNNNKMNYDPTFTSPLIKYGFEQALTSSQWYEFKIDYSTIYTDIVGTITLYNGIDAPTVENIDFNEFNGTISVSYLATQTATHTITIELTGVNGHMYGLSFNSIKLYNSAIFTVTTNISGNIPTGEYTKSELVALISNILGFDFDCEFISCCEVPAIEFDITLPDDDTLYNYKLSPYWQKGYIDYPETDIDTINSNCFTYGILDVEKDVIACSNLFRKETDCCYVSRIEYSNDEDSFGFSYPTGVSNMVNLPFFLSSPNYQVKEEVYRQTDGTYKRITADIEKEYEVETDYMSEFMHDKLIVALKHDTVVVTSNRLNFESQVSQQGDYKIDWNSKIDFSAMASFKLRKYFNGKNNNCGTNCD